MNTVRIALDALPYEKEIWKISDYSGEQIYNKVSLPLVKYIDSKIEYLAASKITYENNTLEIEIREDLYWNNGEKITSDDYERSINYICKDKTNTFSEVLKSVKKHSEFDKGLSIISNKINKLSIKTQWFDPFLLHYLSLINFSPMHKKDKNLSGGPYYIERKSKNSYKLKFNSYFRIENDINRIDSIVYKLTRTDLNGSSFFNGNIDISCDTALDLNRLDSISENKNLKANDKKLAMILSKGDMMNRLKNDEIESIKNTINKESISKTYNNKLKPFNSWMSIYNNKTLESSKNRVKSKRQNLTINISYEDFYPNHKILILIKTQLEKIGIKVKLIKDEYGKRKSKCHFLFEIRRVTENPILIIRSDISKLERSSKNLDYIKHQYSILHNRNTDTNKTLINIDNILIKETIYIPLFILPTAFLCRNNIKEQSIYEIGRYIKTNGNDNDN